MFGSPSLLALNPTPNSPPAQASQNGGLPHGAVGLALRVVWPPSPVPAWSGRKSRGFSVPHGGGRKGQADSSPPRPQHCAFLPCAHHAYLSPPPLSV